MDAPGAPAPIRGNATKWRLFAAGIDNLIATILFLVAVKSMPGDSAVPRFLAAALVYLTYYFIQEGGWGTTLGKRIFGLQVIRLDGRPAGWVEAFGRTMLRIFEANPLLFGMLPGALVTVWSKRRQRLGDMLAETIVVRRAVAAAMQRAQG